MRISSLLKFVILALCTGASASALAESVLSAPDAVIVGAVYLNEPKSFRFTVKNTSRHKVQISEIRISCTCTNVKLDGKEALEPGEESSLSGDLTLVGKAGATYETEIGISYQSEIGSGVVVVPIRGIVTSSVILDKPRLDFGTVDVGAKPESLIVEVRRGNSDERWDSLGATGNRDHVAVHIEKISGDLFRVKVTLDPKGLPISAFRDSVRLRMLQAGIVLRREIEIPLSARIDGPLKASPASVYLGVVTPGKAIERLITVSSLGLDLSDMTVERASEGISARIDHPTRSVAHVTLEIKPLENTATIAGSVVLFHKPTGMRLAVPVLGAIGSAKSAVPHASPPATGQKVLRKS